MLLIPLGLLTLYGSYQQIYLGIPFGAKPGSDTALIVITVCCFAFLCFFWSLHLSSQIDQKSIKIHFFPFVKRSINWDTVEKAEILDYGFIWGWGIRHSFKYGRVYNTKGRCGLAIQLKNGKKILIGTQKGAELTHFLKEHKLF